ncbi:MAG: DMT family transporter [Mariniphaga sp.]|nr:DMT family transporter [Mariniphaga sp.]
MKNKEILGFGSALGAAFFWSFSFIWFKIAYQAYQPITVVIFRLIISAVLILLIASLLKRLQKPTWKDLKLLFLMAFFEPFIYFLGESYGLLYVSSTVAAVIVATIPLFTPIAAWYFYKEKISWMNLAGMFLSFAGVALVVLNKSLQFEASPLGVGLEFGAVFAAIAYSIILKNLASRYNTLSIIAWQNLFGILLFLPIWLILDFKGFIETPYNAKAFRAIILLAVFSSTLAFVFFTESIRKLGINRSNTFINLIPVFVAVLSFFILKDKLTFQNMIGIAIVVSGLFLAQAKRKKPNKKRKAFEIHNV